MGARTGCRRASGAQVELLWPVADVDLDLDGVGRFTVRYLPGRHVLQWPDRRGALGGPGLTVRNFSCPNPAMLRRDLMVRAKLAECGFSFEDICALDGADMGGTTLTGVLRDRLPAAERGRFDDRMADHDEGSPDEEDPFVPVDGPPEETEDDMGDKAISIITCEPGRTGVRPA